MKKQLTILFALVFMVTAAASMAEEATQDAEIVQTTETAWSAPIEEGEWLSAAGLNAEIYLPTGWTISEDTETGFTAADAESTSTLTVELSDLAVEEGSDAQSAFETYLLDLEETYERAAMTGEEAEAAVTVDEACVIVRFVLDDQLVTMTFTPADEGGIAGSALTIAETLYIYSASAETFDVEAAE